MTAGAGKQPAATRRPEKRRTLRIRHSQTAQDAGGQQRRRSPPGHLRDITADWSTMHPPSLFVSLEQNGRGIVRGFSFRPVDAVKPGQSGFYPPEDAVLCAD